MNTDNNNFKELIQVMEQRQRVIKNALAEAQDETHSYILKQDLNRCKRFTNYYKDNYMALTPICVKELLELEKEALNQFINNYGIR
jgi:hypothetical protein